MEQTNSTAASRKSLSEQVRNRILHKIATGELAPGDRVVEARIASELHVSSIPVREAIRELVAKRVLEYVVHKGARVREVSMAETVDALQVKGVLESLAARLAGRRLVEGAARVRQYLGPMRASLLARDYVQFQDHNQSFHRGIVEVSNNPILLTLWDSLAFEVRTRFLMDYLDSVDPEELAREHENVLRAAEAGDAERVSGLLIVHSDYLIEHLKSQMEENARRELPSRAS
jgi:DNA-binding GntR family transcriptional regulator